MKILIGLIIALFILVALPPSVALAVEPPSSISIISAKVVKNTIEDGDRAVVFHYNIAYPDEDEVPGPDYPTESATDVFMFRFYSPDGTVLLATGTPYSFFDFGYGQGVSSLYFSAADNLTWGLAYKINIVGSPAYFESPPSYNYTIPSSAYSPPSVTDQEGNQALMASYILSVCDKLEIARPTVALHGSTDVGIVLSAIGEAYFRGAIPGIQSIAPTLFFTQFYVPEPTVPEYTTDLAEDLGGKLEGTEVKKAMDALGEKAGVSGQFVFGGIFVVGAVGLMIFTSRKFGSIDPGLIASSILMIMAAIMIGKSMMILASFLGLLGGIMLFYMIFFRRT